MKCKIVTVDGSTDIVDGIGRESIATGRVRPSIRSGGLWVGSVKGLKQKGRDCFRRCD